MNPTRRQKLLILKMESVDQHADPMGREAGERLWPEWYTPEMVEDAKRDDFKWRTLYQQEPPSDTGSWVSPEEIQIVDVLPATLSRYILSDLALSVNSGDYSVHAVVGVDPTGSIYVEDMWRQRSSIDTTVDKHLSLIDTYHPLETLIDDDNMAKVYVQLLATRSRERSISVPWKMLPMRGQDKETRAAPLRGMFKRRKVFFKRAEWNRWLTNEILQFPNALGDGVDDGVDALSLIGRRLAMLARPAGEAPPAPPAKTWQDVTLNEMWEEREQSRKLRRV
jgi:predicted phage terminase large subunit-like protein